MIRRYSFFLASVIMLGLTGCGISYSSVQMELSQTLGVDLSQGKLVETQDSHGGFHGDGERWVTLSFANNDLSQVLEEEEAWQKVPLPESLEILLYGKTKTEGTASIQEGPYAMWEIPRVSKGYYFFRDRHGEATATENLEQVLKRGSFNYTVALYDTENKTLYYYELDT